MAKSGSPTHFSKINLINADWDDTALIAAYDRAMNSIKKSQDEARARILSGQPVNRSGKKNDLKSEQPVKHSSGRNKKWKLGDFCQATYSGDNFLYEAEIIEIMEQDKLCSVHFLGYGNKEIVSLSSLLPSQGKSVRAKQLEIAKKMTELKWHVSDICLALYSDDGLYYEAEIMEIHPEDDTCVVKFVGYENEEEVLLDELLPLDAQSPVLTNGIHHSSIDETSSTLSSEASSENIVEDARSSLSGSTVSHQSAHNCFSNSRRHRHHHHHVPSFPLSSTFPPPMNVEMSEELGPVLMAWYMAGYHTGYYQGRSSRL